MERRKEIVKATKECREDYVGLGRYLTPDDIADAFEEGAEWADKTMIEKARKWILHNMPKYVKWHPTESLAVCINNEDMANDFKRAMEE